MQTRVDTLRLLTGWLLGFVLPVLALSMLGSHQAPAIPVALCMLTAVYAAYEVGYLVNDVVVTVRETHPTERLTPGARAWYAERLRLAVALRCCIGGAALALAAALGGNVGPQVLVGWLALWLLFAMYNYWRGRVTILLYLLLNGLRFVLPVWAAAGVQAELPPWPTWLLLYALPNTYVASWKPRYRLPALQRLFTDEAHFRLAWHALVVIGAAVLVWHDATPAAHNFALVAAWLLAIRLMALTGHRRAA